MTDLPELGSRACSNKKIFKPKMNESTLTPSKDHKLQHDENRNQLQQPEEIHSD